MGQFVSKETGAFYILPAAMNREIGRVMTRSAYIERQLQEAWSVKYAYGLFFPERGI